MTENTRPRGGGGTKDQNPRSRWWRGVSAHALRVFFAIRSNSTEEEVRTLPEPSRRFFEAGNAVYQTLSDEERFIMSCYYDAGRDGEGIAHDIGETVSIVYRAIHRAERLVAIELGLLAPD